MQNRGFLAGLTGFLIALSIALGACTLWLSQELKEQRSHPHPLAQPCPCPGPKVNPPAQPNQPVPRRTGDTGELAK